MKLGLIEFHTYYQFAKASPHVHFSKKGNLFAVSADDNQIKILANNRGRQLLQESAFASALTESFRKVNI